MFGRWEATSGPWAPSVTPLGNRSDSWRRIKDEGEEEDPQRMATPDGKQLPVLGHWNRRRCTCAVLPSKPTSNLAPAFHFIIHSRKMLHGRRSSSFVFSSAAAALQGPIDATPPGGRVTCRTCFGCAVECSWLQPLRRTARVCAPTVSSCRRRVEPARVGPPVASCKLKMDTNRRSGYYWQLLLC